MRFKKSEVVQLVPYIVLVWSAINFQLEPRVRSANPMNHNKYESDEPCPTYYNSPVSPSPEVCPSAFGRDSERRAAAFFPPS